MVDTAHDQIIKEVIALMADTWLTACDRRVIGFAPDYAVIFA